MKKQGAVLHREILGAVQDCLGLYAMEDRSDIKSAEFELMALGVFSVLKRRFVFKGRSLGLAVAAGMDEHRIGSMGATGIRDLARILGGSTGAEGCFKNSIGAREVACWLLWEFEVTRNAVRFAKD